MKNDRDKPDRDKCPDEIRINRYILHECKEEERREIENHLIECRLCRMEVVSLTQVQSDIQNEEKWDEQPDHVYDKGMTFIKRMTLPQESLLEVCLRFISEQWEIIRFNGTLIPQPALSVRRKSVEETPSATIVKEFKKYRLEADIKNGMKGTLDLYVRVKEKKEDNLVPQLSFTLKDEIRQRILAESTGDGEIFFESLMPGEYSIKINQMGNAIGTISLNLKK